MVGLIVFAPILLICGIAILSAGSRHIIFRQARIGLHGAPFQILKLTTMKDGAHLNGPLVSTRSDPRATRVGTAIRALRFNELPQLINVLKGDMSIVGPRPEVPDYVARWPSDVKDRILSIKPGLTGLATVEIWHEGSLLEDKEDVERFYLEEILPRKLLTELWYVSNGTPWLDLCIITRTLVKSFGGSRRASRLRDANAIQL